MKRQGIFLIIAALALLTGCSDGAEQPVESVKIIPAGTSEIVMTGTTEETAALTTASGTDTAVSETTADGTGTTASAVTGTTVVSITQTTAAAVGAENAPVFSVVLAPQVTMKPAQTEVTYAATKATTIVTAPIPYQAPISLENTVAVGKEVALSGTGRVIAPDGLNLRSKPSADGEKVVLLTDGTQIEILGMVLSGKPKRFDDNRWYHVKANGKEGYANAEYVAAKFSQRVSELSKEQLCAMTTFLYYQHQTLAELFFFRGGFDARGRDEKDSYLIDEEAIRMLKLKPDGLKLDAIKESFYEYFFKRYYSSQLDRYYAEKNGKLYVAKDCRVYEGENLDDSMYRIFEISDTEIKALVKFAGDENFPRSFCLSWTDGCWKISSDCSVCVIEHDW